MDEDYNKLWDECISKARAEMKTWATKDLAELGDDKDKTRHRKRAQIEVLRDFGHTQGRWSRDMLSVLRSIHEEATMPGDAPTNLNNITKRFAAVTALAAHSGERAARRLEWLTGWLIGFTVALLVATVLLIAFTVALWKIADHTDKATDATNRALAQIASNTSRISAPPKAPAAAHPTGAGLVRVRGQERP